MDTYLNDRQKETLLKVLDNPADSGSVYALNLAELANMYPQSGLLRALLSRARNEGEPALAAALFNGRILHKLYHHAADLAEVTTEQVIFNKASTVTERPVPAPVTESEPIAQAPAEPADLPMDPPAIWNLGQTPVPEAAPVTEPLVETRPETAEDVPADIAPFVPVEEPVNQAPAQEIEPADEPLAPWEMPGALDPEPAAETWTPQPEPVAEAPAAPQPATIEDDEEEFDLEKHNAELNSLIDILEAQNAAVAPALPEVPEVTSFTPPLQANQRPQQPESHIEDEVYDEISSIEEFAVPETPKHVETVIPELEHPLESPVEAPVNKQQEEDTRAYKGSAIGADYFTFDRAYREPAPAASAETTPPVAAPTVPATVNAPQVAEEQQDVSRYHDEQMPYSFMWWLDKTRKEHAQLYQPFAKAPAAAPPPPKVAKRPADELQQQYFENIFHITSIEEFGQEAQPEPVPFDTNKKEDRIIERFIKEEPHINPPSGDRLDTENKAKRSSEDNDEMVTETLARIYTDQMLYPKAIATYKKLMLKFPEKSSYFASRIESLERKTN